MYNNYGSIVSIYMLQAIVCSLVCSLKIKLIIQDRGVYLSYPLVDLYTNGFVYHISHINS